MTVKQLQTHLQCELVAGMNGAARHIEGVYIGDMLSWVMAKAKENSVWITIQTNINVLAVAVMADVSCVLIAENAEIPEETQNKANDEKIPVLRTHLSAYDVAVMISGIMNHD